MEVRRFLMFWLFPLLLWSVLTCSVSAHLHLLFAVADGGERGGSGSASAADGCAERSERFLRELLDSDQQAGHPAVWFHAQRQEHQVRLPAAVSDAGTSDHQGALQGPVRRRTWVLQRHRYRSNLTFSLNPEPNPGPPRAAEVLLRS